MGASRHLRPWRVAVAVSVVAVLAVTGVIVGPPLTFQVSRWWQVRSFGTVLSANRTHLTVPRDSRFALRWKLAVLPCTQWQVAGPAPDPQFLRHVGREQIVDPRDGVGSGGELFLLFVTGHQPGDVELVLDNCIGQSPASQASSFHERRTYHVTID